MENNSINKVLIVIRGGTLQKVFSTDKDLQIDLLDYDDKEFLNDKQAEIEFEKRTNNLKEVY